MFPIDFVTRYGDIPYPQIRRKGEHVNFDGLTISRDLLCALDLNEANVANVNKITKKYPKLKIDVNKVREWNGSAPHDIATVFKSDINKVSLYLCMGMTLNESVRMSAIDKSVESDSKRLEKDFGTPTPIIEKQKPESKPARKYNKIESIKDRRKNTEFRYKGKDGKFHFVCRRLGLIPSKPCIIPLKIPLEHL